MNHGTLTDNNGQKADFRHVILLMTSNVGSREIEQRPVGFGERASAEREDREYLRLFSPEFRNRLDARIAFRPLTREVMGRIVDKFIAELEQQLLARRVSLRLSGAARDFLATRGYDPQFGARPLGRLIQETVKRPLSDEILFGRLARGGGACIELEGEVLRISCLPPPRRALARPKTGGRAATG
jgi:ATP-dependent Clp protease ATP-binding subunit ClpA